jgi:YjjG family noncanonical pyrimidine nucleotidase
MLISWNNYPLILFDFDDTLVDFSFSEKAAISAVCEGYGRTLTDELHEMYRSINLELWQKFDDGLISRDELFYQRFFRFFAKINVAGHPDAANEIFLATLALEVCLFANAKDLLVYLHQRAKIGIVSNGHGPTQRMRARRAGIADLVHFSIISDDIGVGKPHRKMFDSAYDASGLPPGMRTLMIGDNLKADIFGAQAVGFDTCWISNGVDPRLDVTPTYKVNSIQDLKF